MRLCRRCRSAHHTAPCRQSAGCFFLPFRHMHYTPFCFVLQGIFESFCLLLPPCIYFITFFRPRRPPIEQSGAHALQTFRCVSAVFLVLLPKSVPLAVFFPCLVRCQLPTLLQKTKFFPAFFDSSSLLRRALRGAWRSAWRGALHGVFCGGSKREDLRYIFLILYS